MMGLNVMLPTWATMYDEKTVVIDATGMYQTWLGLLGVEEKDIDQYWLECAYQCGKLDVQLHLALAQRNVAGVSFIISDMEKASGKWRQDRYPPGKGAEAASKGNEARMHFKRIRNIPSL